MLEAKNDDYVPQRWRNLAPRSLISRLSAHAWSALASMLVVGLVAYLWNNLDKQERALIGETTVATANNLQNLVRQDLNGRVTVLDGLAHRWRTGSAIDRERWSADAKNIYDAEPGFRRVLWIDRSLNIRWVVPLESNLAAVDENIRSRPRSSVLFETAQETGAAVVSAPIKLIEGDMGILIMVPAHRSDQFDGVIAGVLPFESWFDTLLQAAPTADYEFAILMDNQTVFGKEDFRSAVDEEWVQEIEFELHNHTWRIAAAPSAMNLALVHSRFSDVMSGTAILLGLLVYIAVYASMKSRQRAALLLSTSRRLEGLLANLPGMLCRRSAHEPWQIIYSSEGSRELCGYDREDLEQQRVRWDELIHPDDVGSANAALAKAIEDEKPYETEYRILTQSGTERWVWERGRVMGNEFEKSRAIEALITDITDRKLAEFELREAQSYSAAIVDAAVEAVITIGADSQILAFNREAEEIFGYTEEEVIGRNFLMMLPNIYHSEHNEFISYFNENGKLKYAFRHREMQLLRKDGTECPSHVSVHEMPNQKVQQFVVTIRDVSTEHAAEEQAREYREKLAHAARLNMLGEMASGIAHEVNQPLTAISLFSQAGKRLLEAGKQQQLPGVFDKLSQHAQRAGAVIERMQTMARQQVSRQETIACDRLIHDVVGLAEAEARIRDIDIEINLEENLPLVTVDSVQIQQVVLNLLRNGMEAMRADGCQHGNTIELSVRSTGADTIEISVTDSGGGIAYEVAQELFTPFSTTKDSGMGMGLAISQSIVTAHGGNISFENNSTGGATFSFTLAAVRQED